MATPSPNNFYPIANGPACDRVLRSCDRALNEEEGLVQEQDKQLKNYEKDKELDKRIIADKDAQLSSPLRDPLKVAGVTVIGVLVLELLTGVFHK